MNRESKLITLTNEAAELARSPLTRANAQALCQLLTEAVQLLDDLPRVVVDNGR